MTTEKTAPIRRCREHTHCLLCGNRNPRSLRLRFRCGDDGVVRAVFRANPQLQGYEGIIHGGIIAALLDAAMTHCLFQHKVQGITGDLHVRYVHSVPCDADINIRAWLVSCRRSLYRLKAEIESQNKIAAWAEATFMRRRLPDPAVADPKGGTGGKKLPGEKP